MNRNDFRIMEKAGKYIVDSPEKGYKAFNTLTEATKWIDQQVSTANGYNPHRDRVEHYKGWKITWRRINRLIIRKGGDIKTFSSLTQAHKWIDKHEEAYE